MVDQYQPIIVGFTEFLSEITVDVLLWDKCVIMKLIQAHTDYTFCDAYRSKQTKRLCNFFWIIHSSVEMILNGLHYQWIGLETTQHLQIFIVV